LKILIITQYFYPENFRINDVCLGLKERGHEVVVLTGKPNYPNGIYFNGYGWFKKSKENWKDIKIFRSNLFLRGNGNRIRLMLNYFSFAFFASLKIFTINGQFDKIFIFAPSPITVGIPGIFAKYKFNASMYFWVQDLWPESISAAGGTKNKVILSILNWLTIYIYKHSDKVLVQSNAFIPYILNQKVELSKLVYYPNSTENYYTELDPDEQLLKTLPSGFKLMFAGNIGESQSFETLLNAALILKNQGIKIHWIILGDGRGKELVKKKINDLKLLDCFHLLGSFPSSDMPNFFSCADALLVSLKKDPIFALTIPSKIQSYLACGKAILTCLDGEGSRIIEEAKAGFTSPSEDPIALAEIIKKFLNLSIEERRVLGKNARNYFNNQFEREFLFDKLENIFKICTIYS
jgi:glycosyltransferase involved in cell wall biosynthesis